MSRLDVEKKEQKNTKYGLKTIFGVFVKVGMKDGVGNIGVLKSCKNRRENSEKSLGT